LISEEITLALRKRYSEIPPLIFQRSVDRARNDTELFDILEGIPKKYPLVWCDKKRCWTTAKDLLATWSFDFGRIKK